MQLGVNFVLFSLALGLLLPLLVAAAAFIVVTWVWAAASALALASTPAMSQAGLALWMLAQVYLLTGGGDPIRSECIHKCHTVFRVGAGRGGLRQQELAAGGAGSCVCVAPN